MQKLPKPLILSCILLFGMSYFTVRFPDFEYSAIISYLLIILMAVPSYMVLVKWLGFGKGIITILILGVIPLIVEAFAVHTGIPYGHFVYSESLGYKLFDLVPVTVSFAYLPMLFGAVSIAGQKSRDIIPRSLLGGIVSVIIDLVIDPATVAGGLWIWENAGFFYGVPLSNFVGWLLTGTLYSYIFYRLNGNPADVPIGLTNSLLLILSFWSGFLIWKGLILPVLIGISLIGYIIKFHVIS